MANRKQTTEQFVKRWQKAEGNEDREARSFLIEFLTDVLGIDNPTRILDFERRVKGRKVDGNTPVENVLAMYQAAHNFGTY